MKSYRRMWKNFGSFLGGFESSHVLMMSSIEFESLTLYRRWQVSILVDDNVGIFKHVPRYRITFIW